MEVEVGERRAGDLRISIPLESTCKTSLNVPPPRLTFDATSIEPSLRTANAGKRVAVRIGGDSEILLAPDDPRAFFADVAAHAPHLMRRDAELVLA